MLRAPQRTYSACAGRTAHAQQYMSQCVTFRVPVAQFRVDGHAPSASTCLLRPAESSRASVCCFVAYAIAVDLRVRQVHSVCVSHVAQSHQGSGWGPKAEVLLA